MKRTILLIVAAALFTLPAMSSTHAANIYVTQRLLGGVIIHIDGDINLNDEQRFARIASQYPSGTVVEPDSLGGIVGPALGISDLIWKRGFDTMLMSYDVCASACTLIWLSGRHSVIQRNTPLCFHQAYNSQNGETSSEANEYIAAHLQAYGLTAHQARALINAAPPESARCATEWWAIRLGFRPQIVPTPFAMRSCQSKFCLTMP
jgi:hypothetical protein